MSTKVFVNADTLHIIEMFAVDRGLITVDRTGCLAADVVAALDVIATELVQRALESAEEDLEQELGAPISWCDHYAEQLVRY